MQDTNEITLGEATIARIEEMYGPVMPRTSSSRTCPSTLGRTTGLDLAEVGLA
ncbi:hypothetical protein ACFQ6S_06550 [Streptomyces sp. NPDC056479]|uniref:hypothetical protein n=1 Tax=Streptomyces sp. NPDC056479 TaxID=3345832 RepID=UPI0036CE45EC